MSALFHMLSMLPMAVLHALATVLAWVAQRVLGYRRQVVRDNLARCFPEKSQKELRQLESAFYLNLADVLVESLKLLTISPAQLAQRVQVEGRHHINQAMSTGRPAIVLTSHQCNWEMMLQGYTAGASHAVAGTYQPLSNAKIDALMLHLRSRMGAQLVPSKQLLRYLVAHKQQPVLVAMVADQTPMPGQSYRTTFLGRPTDFFTGPVGLATRFSLPVYYVEMLRIKRGYYQISLSPLATPPYANAEQEILEAFVRQAERSIRKQPANWLWSHRRWKHIAPEEGQGSGPVPAAVSHTS